MLAQYTFNTHSHYTEAPTEGFPSLHLLEGGQYALGQYSPILIPEYGQVRLRFYQWGLQPSWQKRSESLSFLDAGRILKGHDHLSLLGRKRCLVPADGFLVQSGKDVYRISLQSEKAFCFAAVYEQKRMPNGSNLQSFAILSTQANVLVGKFHHSMPLIVPKAYEKHWLNPRVSSATLAKLLQPFDPNQMKLQRVNVLKEFGKLPKAA